MSGLGLDPDLSGFGFKPDASGFGFESVSSGLGFEPDSRDFGVKREAGVNGGGPDWRGHGFQPDLSGSNFSAETARPGSSFPYEKTNLSSHNHAPNFILLHIKAYQRYLSGSYTTKWDFSITGT